MHSSPPIVDDPPGNGGPSSGSGGTFAPSVGGRCGPWAFRCILESNDHPRPSGRFDADDTLRRLKHYLPAQAPLKDFVHHNTLHAFQHGPFHSAARAAERSLGFRTKLELEDYRTLHSHGRISDAVLERVISERFGADRSLEWKERLLNAPFEERPAPRIGQLRACWKRDRRVDLDAIVHPLLFRTLNSYLDQGVALWAFPLHADGFLSSVRELERSAWSGFLRGKRAKELLLDERTEMAALLDLVVGDERQYERYLFDQQFMHAGWSGMVSVVEDRPGALLDARPISLEELIMFELIMEIDALDRRSGTGKWRPLCEGMSSHPAHLFGPDAPTALDEAREVWQEAFEWSYHDQVIKGIRSNARTTTQPAEWRAMALFCIDDRSCSIRRYLEHLDPGSRTFGTPGHFGVEFYYRPDGGKFNTKCCPAPVTPKHLVKAAGPSEVVGGDPHFAKRTHTLFGGWLGSQALGPWAAVQLFRSVFTPSKGPGMSSSFQHMDPGATLTVENLDPSDREDGLRVGFTVPEMALRVESVLRSIGLVDGFATVVYVVGHGASSMNNPHYAAYDCGACCGRPGSVNARVFCHMANHHHVRRLLENRGIRIPATTQFVGALHDTTRDEIVFFDENTLSHANSEEHRRSRGYFGTALHLNAKERSRRFASVDSHRSAERVHKDVRKRSVSIFEPRPELNHATNAVCVIGRRRLTRGLFMDRRSFLNSYDPGLDPDGSALSGILKAAVPVCGGINLEYFFSRVDDLRAGAGTKLPHNVMGLIGVSNGVEGDLRPGLPTQMTEVHDPVRLMMVVEQEPEVVRRVIASDKDTLEWFKNEWIHLVALRPNDRTAFRYRQGDFHPYEPITPATPHVRSITPLLEKEWENCPVHLVDEP